ncbi:Hsp20/alpha crystallin family protein [Salipaludibacillus aurantiacus]|uniref:HSP20 family protein n=1 Tax=Salipaludibacillus aurantiacus TaxID=1601833 RepID=A0A1H9TE37_9BACI|nr:Hsp20/alpha crystallin family protein [Salipaludibacillus aurantiacus]SER95590.1 HSP20 family protein [Salipaludibacillus aurantiacus]
MANLFPKRRRDVFEWLPSFLDRDSTTDLFDSSFGFQSPKVDIKEKKDHYVIEAELPGFSKEDISVEYKDGHLTIQGKTERSAETKDDQYVRRERSSGSFQRSFYIGDINEKEIQGEFKNGLLVLNVPKTREELDESSGYRIDIN